MTKKQQDKEVQTISINLGEPTKPEEIEVVTRIPEVEPDFSWGDEIVDDDIIPMTSRKVEDEPLGNSAVAKFISLQDVISFLMNVSLELQEEDPEFYTEGLPIVDFNISTNGCISICSDDGGMEEFENLGELASAMSKAHVFIENH